MALVGVGWLFVVRIMPVVVVCGGTVSMIVMRGRMPMIVMGAVSMIGRRMTMVVMGC